MKSRTFTTAFFILCVCLLSPSARGQAVVPVVVSTVADNTLAIPGGTGTFQSFNPNLAGLPPNPCISNGNIAFWGGGSGGQQGIYGTFAGSPTKIADLNTAIPIGIGDFLSYPPQPVISGNNVAFIGNGGTGQQGVYASLNGTLSRIADASTLIPSGTGDFATFGSLPVISGANVAFIGGDGASQTGVYKCFPPNPCAPVADTNTSIPGGTGSFNFFLPNQPALALSGQNVGFIGGQSASGALGVYACFPPNPCAPVADNNALATIPGLPGSSFIAFQTLSLSGTNIAFTGLSSPDGGKDVFEGVYVGFPPNPCASACTFSLSVIADSTMAVPSGNGTFTGFGDVAIDPANVVFEGFSNTAKGLYASISGSLVKIVADGDVLGGRTVSDLHLGSGGFSGNQVVFEVEFTDGSQATAAASFSAFTRCPHDQGFWKNHKSQWPVTTLVLGNENYSQNELLAILNTSSTSDASLILSRQLIAAKLNIANFSNPAPVNSTISDADGLLSTFSGKLPYNVKSSSTTGTQMTSDASTLVNYNEGQLTPACTH